MVEYSRTLSKRMTKGGGPASYVPNLSIIDSIVQTVIAYVYWDFTNSKCQTTLILISLCCEEGRDSKLCCSRNNNNKKQIYLRHTMNCHVSQVPSGTIFLATYFPRNLLAQERSHVASPDPKWNIED